MPVFYAAALAFGSTIGGFGLALILIAHRQDRLGSTVFPVSCIFAIAGISFALAAAFAIFFK